jgi:hypothetical protein
MLKFIITQASGSNVATVILKNKPVVVPASDPCYEQVVEMLKNPEATEEALEGIIFAKAKRVEAAIFGEGDFALDNGVVTFKGATLPHVLSERLLSMAREGFDVSPLKKFVENLFQNPSNRVFQQLYGFIDHGQMAITPDGCFLAYKKVRPDFLDIHSGKFDNSVGKTLSMPRIMVDDDPHNTCSSGFHVCSYDYLGHFGGDVDAGYHVVTCKVNPKDVVSVPVDYNNTKMRVCAYEVIGEVDDYVRKNENVLASASVSDGIHFDNFVVETLDEDGDWTTHDSHSKLSDAFEQFNDLKNDMDDDSAERGVRVVNSSNGEVLESFEY